MKVEKFVSKYFYKEDLQDLLEREGLKVSGTKNELIRRLRRDAKYDILQFIAYLDKDELKFICEDLDLKKTGTKNELADRVFEEIWTSWNVDYYIKEMRRVADNEGWTEKKWMKFMKQFQELEEVEKPKKEILVEERVTRREAKDTTLNLVLDEIKSYKRRATKFSGKRKEKLYTTALTGYLSHAFPNIEMEQSLGKGARVDARIGNIGIEAKYRPDQNEINRLYGQIDTYLQFMDSIIVVFFDTSSGIVNDFEKKLHRGGYTRRVEIVNI